MSDAVVNGLAGAGGGLIAQLLTYPLQAVNTREQTERKAKKSRAGDPGTDSFPDENRQKSSLPSEIWKVVKNEGWGGLYRGLEPSLVGTVCSQGVYYYFYRLLRDEAEAFSLERKKRGSGDGTVGIFSSLLVASLAGCANVLLTNPLWVIVTRMQTQSKAQAHLAPLVKPKSQGTLATVRDLYDEAGVVGFWKGVLPTLIMVSNPAIQFMLYESLVKWVTKRRPRKRNGIMAVTATEVFALGAIAKLGATVATYPLLVVKSRLQAKQSISGDTAQQYAGTVDAIIKMIRHEGVLGFYRGMSTKIVQSVMAAAVLLLVKEQLVKGARTLGVKEKYATARAVS